MNAEIPASAAWLVLFLAACGDAASTHEHAALPASNLPARYRLAEEPAGAKPVGAVHAAAKDGEEVALVGVVGGSERPFVEGLAAFTIVDPALASCEGDGMGCKTPWDYCCVDPKRLAESTATIEFREGEKTLALAPRGFDGLDHLKTVVVAGTAERDAGGNLTVVARGIRVRP